MYQDLSTRRDWPVKKAIIDLPIRLKGNSKRTSGNSLSRCGTRITYVTLNYVSDAGYGDPGRRIFKIIIHFWETAHPLLP